VDDWDDERPLRSEDRRNGISTPTHLAPSSTSSRSSTSHFWKIPQGHHLRSACSHSFTSSRTPWQDGGSDAYPPEQPDRYVRVCCLCMIAYSNVIAIGSCDVMAPHRRTSLLQRNPSLQRPRADPSLPGPAVSLTCSIPERDLPICSVWVREHPNNLARDQNPRKNHQRKQYLPILP